MSTMNIYDAATLMFAIGEEQASEIVKFMNKEDVKKLANVMAMMKTIDQDRLNRILAELGRSEFSFQLLDVDNREFINNMLTMGVGKNEASLMMGGLVDEEETSYIESIQWRDPQLVSNLISNEPSYIIATILSQIEPSKASEILSYYTKPLREEVMLKIATMEGVEHETLKEVNNVLERVFSSNESYNKQMGGVKSAANIINYMEQENESHVIDRIKTHDYELALRIMDEMFVFENIADIDNQGILKILNAVDSRTLTMSLRGTTDEFKERIFSNMSTRAANSLREELENSEKVKKSEVEDYRKKVLEIVRRLADEGEITIGAKADDEYI